MSNSSVWTRLEKSIDIGIPSTDKRLMHWNPSITRHADKLYVSYRSYQLSEESFRQYTSPLVVGILENDLVTEYKEIKPRNVPEYIKISNIEDVRIWSDGKDLYGIGVVLKEFPNKRLDVHLAEIKINYIKGYYDLVRDFGQPFNHPEKNWSPIEGRPFEYMYSVDTLYKDGDIIPTCDNLVNPRIIHNGTNLVKIKDGYISIIHQRTRLRNGIGCYPNMFVKYNNDLSPTHCTDFFVFKDYMNEEVQFMSGSVMLDEDTIGITVGLDRITARREALYKSLLYKVKLNDIDWQPFNLTPLRYGFYRQGDK